MKTKDNLMEAFAGESQARNKYDFFAKVAYKEGYNYIGKIFEETAINEMQHAKDLFKRLSGISNTKDNLKEAIKGETHETDSMYPEFAKIAKEEGLEDEEMLFTEISNVEKKHNARFKRMLKLVEEGKVFERDEPIKWICSKCGYVHEDRMPPEECPSCKKGKLIFGEMK